MAGIWHGPRHCACPSYPIWTTHVIAKMAEPVCALNVQHTLELIAARCRYALMLNLFYECVGRWPRVQSPQAQVLLVCNPASRSSTLWSADLGCPSSPHAWHEVSVVASKRSVSKATLLFSGFETCIFKLWFWLARTSAAFCWDGRRMRRQV